MKRAKHLFESIYDTDNIHLAFWKAAKGKRDRKEVMAFANDFETNVGRLHHQIKTKRPDIGNYRFFQICDPKKRRICAADFPERVLHHAIMNICEPVLDAYAIFHSYACRKGKGTLAALRQARAFAGRYAWFLKLDIRKYFDSIDHAVLQQLIERRINDKDVTTLFSAIFATYRVEAGKGLPIGNLISQHMANFYLGKFDHWIKEDRRIKGFLRYMDDFVLFAHEKERLKQELRAVRAYLRTTLKLELKDNIQLNRCAHGLPFLGCRIFPEITRLSNRSKRRFINKYRAFEQNMVDGKWSAQEYVRHMEPLVGFTQMANAAAFRNNVIKRFRVSQ
jgi:retron-type reverse transcriptase